MSANIKPDHKKARRAANIAVHVDPGNNLARCYLDLSERHRRLKALAEQYIRHHEQEDYVAIINFLKEE